MANMFKRAALTIGRWTGIKRQSEFENRLALLEPISGETGEFSDSIDAGADLNGSDVPPLDASGNPWNDAISTSDVLAKQDTDAAIEAAIATGQFDETSNDAFGPDSIQPAENQPAEISAIAAVAEVTAEHTSIAESVIVAQSSAPVAEEVKAPIELKPEPAAIPTPRPSVSFTQLYELISTEVNKRTDSTVTVYEKLLAATREELESTRKSNRVAWSIGGVMTAVAAFGAIWAAGEVAATRVEVSGLKQQVITGQQASAERDLFRSELIKSREASAKIEIDTLRSRLDQAISVTAERDRLRDELQIAQKARQESEVELRNEIRLARAATTQPLSQVRPAAEKAAAREASNETVAGAGAERPDVWSTLLNGRDDR